MNIFKATIKTFKILLNHKKKVFKICFKKGLYMEAITHDLSSFRFKELIPLIKYNAKDESDHLTYYDLSIIHCESNSHHYNYFKINEQGFRIIPFQNIDYIIIDWEAQGIDPKSMYCLLKLDMRLHPTSELYLKSQLKI